MARNTTSDSRSFSIYRLKAWGMLKPECTSYGNIVWSRYEEEVSRIGYVISTLDGDSYMELDYRTRWHDGEEWKPIKYKIPLEGIRCHFGGIRWFFRCPIYRSGNYCGRRVGKMYKMGDYFACRHCADLTYESCNEGKRFRGGMFKFLADSWKADDFYHTLKRTQYGGKPTRKYRKYLKLSGFGRDMTHALKEFNRMLGRGKI